jgi:hypothetical protein
LSMPRASISLICVTLSRLSASCAPLGLDDCSQVLGVGLELREP